MGSLLAGSKALVEEGRRVRKMLGGGVRQGGVMGAAGLVALDYLPRLPEDHAKARALAEGLRNLGFASPEPETNILLVPVPDTAKAIALMEAAGVRVLPVGASLRFITHRDLADADIAEALARLEPLAAAILAA